MPIEEKNQPQDEDDGFPSFLRAPKKNENEDSNELVDLSENEASELTLSETPQAAESEKLLEEEGEFDLDSMLEDVSEKPDFSSEEADILTPEDNEDIENLLPQVTEEDVLFPEDDAGDDTISFEDVTAETEPEAEVAPEAEVEAETEPKAEVAPEAEVEAEAEPEAEVAPEAEVEAETEPEAEVASEAEVEAETEPEAEVASEAEIEAETEPETEVAPEAEVEDEAEPEAEVVPEAEVEAETEPEAEVAPEAEVEPEAEVVPEAEAEPEEDEALTDDKAYHLMSGQGVQAIDLSAYEGRLYIDTPLKAGASEWVWIERRQRLQELGNQENSIDLKRVPSGVNFITLVKGGDKKIDLFNRESLRFEEAEAKVYKEVEGDFILGQHGFDSGLIVEDFCPQNLADIEEERLVLADKSGGLICGPGVAAFVDGLQELCWKKAVYADGEKEQLKNLKWYSGTFQDKYFEIDGNSEPTELLGTDEINSIHVNCGGTTYGWNVRFNNGLTMSLRDLREYQIKHGQMPASEGVLSRGDLEISFAQINRIVVYETAQYFTYR